MIHNPAPAPLSETCHSQRFLLRNSMGRPLLSFTPSFTMSLSAKNITHLPTALQSYILSSLSSRHPHSIGISLDTANRLRNPLPNDLLSVAQSSRELSKAVADALGPSAQVLNNNSAAVLSEWVTALGPAVKAVSFFDSNIERLENLGGFTYKPQQFFDELCDNAIKTLNALSGEGIALEVLDVKSIPFWKCTKGDVLLRALVNALQRSANSLRELGMRVTPISAKAAAGVALPVLEVAELELKEIDGADAILTGEKGKTAEAFMQALQALEVHVDKVKAKSTLRELRLINLHEAPCVNGNAGCSGLFKAVTTLKVEIIPYDEHDNDSVAKFISLFPNLESLHWNGTVTASHLHIIHEACSNLAELHLSPVVRFTPTATSAPEGDSMILQDFFIACQDKLRTIKLSARLTTEQLNALGQNNPSLELLEMEIGRENVGALPLLLGTHCRKLRKLHLLFTPEDEECLGEQGWKTFTEAVQSASYELSDVSIVVDDDREPMEYAVDVMTQSMIDIVEFLGERARRVCFRVPMATMAQRVRADAVCRIMRACVTHTKSLESLEASFILVDAEECFESEEEEKETWTRLVKQKKRMLEELPRLQHYYFGLLDEVAEERLEELED